MNYKGTGVKEGVISKTLSDQAVWQLSKAGRVIPYSVWKNKLGGCGLPNNTNAFSKLGPEAKWSKEITLGDIEDACPYTGRALAGFAVRNLGHGSLAEPYETIAERQVRLFESMREDEPQ